MTISVYTAIQNDDLWTIKIFHTIFNYKFSYGDLNLAVRCGNMDTIKYLCDIVNPDEGELGQLILNAYCCMDGEAMDFLTYRQYLITEDEPLNEFIMRLKTFSNGRLCKYEMLEVLERGLTLKSEEIFKRL